MSSTNDELALIGLVRLPLQRHTFLDRIGENCDEKRRSQLCSKKSTNIDIPHADNLQASDRILPGILTELALSPATISIVNADIEKHVLPATAKDARNKSNLHGIYKRLFQSGFNYIQPFEFVFYFGLGNIKRDFLNAFLLCVQHSSLELAYRQCCIARDARWQKVHRTTRPAARWTTSDLVNVFSSLAGQHLDRDDLRRGGQGDLQKPPKQDRRAQDCDSDHEAQDETDTSDDTSTADPQPNLQSDLQGDSDARPYSAAGDLEPNLQSDPQGDSNASADSAAGDLEPDLQSDPEGISNDEPTEEEPHQLLSTFSEGLDANSFYDAPVAPVTPHRQRSPVRRQLLTESTEQSIELGRPEPRSDISAVSPAASWMLWQNSPGMSPCPTRYITTTMAPGGSTRRAHQNQAQKRTAESQAAGHAKRPKQAADSSALGAQLLPDLTAQRAQDIAELLSTENARLDGSGLYYALLLLNAQPNTWHIIPHDFVRPGANTPLAEDKYVLESDHDDLPEDLLVPLMFPSTSHCCIANVHIKDGSFAVYDPLHAEQYLEPARTAMEAFMEHLQHPDLPDEYQEFHFDCKHRLEPDTSQDPALFCLMAAVALMSDSDDLRQIDELRVGASFLRRALHHGFSVLAGERSANPVANQPVESPKTATITLQTYVAAVERFDELVAGIPPPALYDSLTHFFSASEGNSYRTSDLDSLEKQLVSNREQQQYWLQRGHPSKAGKVAELIPIIESEQRKLLAVLRQAEFMNAVKSWLLFSKANVAVASNEARELRQLLLEYNAAQAGRWAVTKVPGGG